MVNKVETKKFNVDTSNVCQTAQEKADEVNSILDYIKENRGITIWKLSKVFPISRSKIFYICRDLEFSGAIYSKISTNSDNRQERKLYAGRNK